jgi:hypothetical protein
MVSGFNSFNASAFNGFIHSGFNARGVPSPLIYSGYDITSGKRLLGRIDAMTGALAWQASYTRAETTACVDAHIGSDGMIYAVAHYEVAGTRYREIIKVTMDGDIVYAVSRAMTGDGWWPVRIRADGRGSLFVSHSGGHLSDTVSLEKCSADDGSLITEYVWPIYLGGGGMDVAPDGSVYVTGDTGASPVDYYIFKFDNDLSPVWSIGTRGAVGLGVDVRTDGNVMSDAYGITIFTPSGTILVEQSMTSPNRDIRQAPDDETIGFAHAGYFRVSDSMRTTWLFQKDVATEYGGYAWACAADDTGYYVAMNPVNSFVDLARIVKFDKAGDQVWLSDSPPFIKTFTSLASMQDRVFPI